ncbi:MAG: corrinoid protein [Verrucomicrobia bacterium]|nr:corrinoid protein [Verrucomicrobiota bacterium]MDA1086521.1 corrinoid protein [Verrucomicrobiota bacterium]
MTDLSTLYDAILSGDHKTARSLAQTALDENTDPKSIVDKYMIPAMDEAGRRFEANVFYVPELLIAARAMKAAMELIRPKLLENHVEPAGRVVVGTVQGDLHDIGKNLVASMLEGGGFEVIDLGVDVSPEQYVAAATEHGANLIALSALLTTTMPGMRAVVDLVKQSPAAGDLKVMIGGAPITQTYADEIGADGFSDNASGAVNEARRLVGVTAA